MRVLYASKLSAVRADRSASVIGIERCNVRYAGFLQKHVDFLLCFFERGLAVSRQLNPSLELAKRFSKLRPAVPILLFSGTAKEGTLVVDLESPVGFLEKPFTPAQLIEKVDTLL